MSGETRMEWLRRMASEYCSNVCLLWPGSLHWKGYGQLTYKKKVMFAHRVMCELAHGPAPSEKHQAAHSCVGQRSCVNFLHLRWALPVENSADMVRAGNSTRGERCAQAKLTASQVITIRQSQDLQRVLAAQYGVSQSTISVIKAGKTWAHV